MTPTTEAASDASLLERFVASRDEAAFELLLWRHGPMVLTACRRMLGCEQDAEDAFQAAFLLLGEGRRHPPTRSRGRLAVSDGLPCRPARPSRPKAARRCAARAWSRPRRTADPDVVWRDLRPVLDEEVHGLPAKYRLAIILCYFQGRTHAEAARELGCPKGTVSVRLQRRGSCFAAG